MPEVFVHGRPPDVRGCGMCHMPNGKGRPENAPLAGLPYAYVVQQLSDFKNDLRTSADARKTNTAQMIPLRKSRLRFCRSRGRLNRRFSRWLGRLALRLRRSGNIFSY